jgi:hypothetical protein
MNSINKRLYFSRLDCAMLHRLSLIECGKARESTKRVRC